MNWFLYVLWRSVYFSTYQDSVVHFSLIQLKPRGVSIWIFSQNRSWIFRKVGIILLKNVCYSIQLFPAWKITDSLWIQQRQGELCLLSESDSNISAYLASCHLSKCGDITEGELMLGKERAFVLGIRELDYLPETWTFIWKILVSGKVMPVHLLGRL